MKKESDPTLGSDRLGKIRNVLSLVESELPDDILSDKLEPGQTTEDAFRQFPGGEKLPETIRQAEIRRIVSKRMFDIDADLSKAEQDAIIERQINRYFEFAIGNPSVRGHVEAPHGIKPSDEVSRWCLANNITSFEIKTAVIARKTANHIIFKKSRLVADINSLPSDVESSLRSEGAVYT